MLCRVIPHEGVAQVLSKIRGAEMAEIRLDTNKLSAEDINKVFNSHANLIATYREVNGISLEERKDALKLAVDSGAAWIDIEIEANEDYRTELTAFAKSKGCKVIISYHNYAKTPSKLELLEIIKEAGEMQADWIKLACQVNNPHDNASLLSLYQMEHPLIVLGMGELGKVTRIAATKLGSPFTFVAHSEDAGTAPGQLTEQQMKEVLNYL